MHVSGKCIFTRFERCFALLISQVSCTRARVVLRKLVTVNVQSSLRKRHVGCPCEQISTQNEFVLIVQACRSG